MPMILTDEQEMLQETVREFVTEHAPVTHLRALRDDRDDDGFSRKLWKEMAELGWAGITVEEAYGGSGLGYAEVGILLEEAGRTLMPAPFLSTLVMGTSLVEFGGGEALKAKVLPGVCSGDTLLAVGIEESGRFDPYRIGLRAEPSGQGYRLTGQKSNVLDGHVANQLIVVARTSGDETDRSGLTLFLVDPRAAGVSVTRTVMSDSHNTAQLALEGVEVAADAILGEVDAGTALLEAMLDRATVAVSAELLGLSREAFDRTIAYLKTRDQFGVKIGSFQALKHRAAEMFCELELSESIVLDALRAIDEAREELPSLASAAKARLADTASLVTREAIQMHGGIGMTDEEEIGFFLKRAKTAELLLGDAIYHRNRFALLQGY
jgi:alkylation response protein AidB-like acyl-CoA dehydrogenase